MFKSRCLNLKEQNFGEFSSPNTKFDPFDAFGILKFVEKQVSNKTKHGDFIKTKLELN